MRLRLGFVSLTALTRPSHGFRRQWVNTLVIPDQTSTTPALEHLATYWLSTQWPWAGQVLLNGCAHANDYRRGPRPSKPLSVAGQTSECRRPNLWVSPAGQGDRRMLRFFQRFKGHLYLLSMYDTSLGYFPQKSIIYAFPHTYSYNSMPRYLVEVWKTIWISRQSEE